MWFFRMSRNSICFAQMGDNIVGGVESVFWTNMFNLLSNLGGGILWFEDA